MSETTQTGESCPGAGVAMLCQGTEVYGVGTVQKLYARTMPGLWFICMEEGALTDWLREHNHRVRVLDGGLSTFTAGRSSVGTLLRVPKAWAKAKADAARLDAVLANEGIEIVHTHWLPQQLVAGHLRRRGYKVVWHIHNNMARRRLAGMGVRLNHQLARWGADGLIAVSDFIGRNYAGSGVPVWTVHNAATSLGVVPAAPPTAPPVRCLIAGRLEESKGHHLAVEAVAAAAAAGKDVLLDVYGGPVEGNAYARRLLDIGRASGAAGRVRLMGFADDLRRRHGEYHVGLQCRIDPEPCSVWVCEAMLDGLPLIASASGGTPELVEDGVTGLLFESGNASDLATKLIDLAVQPQRFQQMRAASLERGARCFSEQRFLGQTMAVYRRLRKIGAEKAGRR